MSKKRKIGDPGNSRTIPSFFGAPKQQAQQSQSREPGTKTQNQSSSHTESPMETSSDVKVKKEPGEDVKEVSHRHRFYIQFQPRNNKKNEINCKTPQTVLQAIRSVPLYATLGWSDENLVIQRTEGDNISTIATHFPCCLIKEKEMLIISKRKNKVEEVMQNVNVHRNFLSEDSYAIFYIDTEGENNTKKNRLFISTKRQDLKPLCVYGEKGKEITVEKALKQDGRFKPLSNFSLNIKTEVLQSSAVIDDLHGRTFKIELPKENQTNVSDKSKPHTSSAKKRKRDDMAGAAADGHTNRTTAATNMAAQPSDSVVAPALLQQRGIGVEKALSESSSDADREEIYKLLRDQFSELKKLMESRFTADSFQNALSMKEKNFGKMRQSFREVHRLRKMICLGELVCKVVVGDVTGTGFVLFDNYIMTNAHLFDGCTDGDKLREGVDVHVIFNYEELLPNRYSLFKVEHGLIYFIEDELDYAVLQVNPQALTQSVVQFPSGLLERVGEMPEKGEACIIGHPKGEVKQIDLTYIIEMEKREQAAGENLSKYKDKLRIIFVDQVKSQGIEKIMRGRVKAEKGGTYHTFMYHGASGSPVFDAQGSLCGLHTSGFVYGSPEVTGSAIEFAYSMKIIITHLVKKLHEKNLTDLLQRMKDVAGNNPVLREIFNQPV